MQTSVSIAEDMLHKLTIGHILMRVLLPHSEIQRL